MAKKRCNVGWGCGNACISRTKNCESVHPTELQGAIRGFTGFVRKAIEFGQKDVTEFLPKGPEPVKVESNVQLLNDVLNGGKAKVDSIITPEIVAEQKRIDDERKQFQLNRLEELKKKVAEMEANPSRELADELQSMIANQEFYDDIDRLDNELDDLLRSKRKKEISQEEYETQLNTLQEQKVEAQSKTPMGAAFSQLREEFLGNHEIPENYFEEDFNFDINEEETAVYAEVSPARKEYANEAAEEVFKMTGLRTDVLYDVGHIKRDGKAMDRAFATISRDGDERLLPEFDNSENREALLKELGETYDGGQINIGEDSTYLGLSEVMYHEMGHLVEAQNPDIADMNRRWLESRATSTRPQSLRKMTGLNYGRKEVALPDQFMSPYVGRIYESADSLDVSTEVFSMGYEHFNNPARMIELFEGDREHFDLIVGTLMELGKRK